SDLSLQVDVDGGGVVSIVLLAGMKAVLLNGKIDLRGLAAVSGQLHLTSSITTIMTDGSVLSQPHAGRWQSEVQVERLSPDGTREHVEYRNPAPFVYTDSFRGFGRK